MPLPESRLLVDAYDSANQPIYTDWNSRRFWVFLGRLRLDALLYDRIILKDGSVFDGVFFLDCAKRMLLDHIPWQKIEIRSRATSLDEAIVDSLKGKASPKLLPVFLSGLPSTYNSMLGDIAIRVSQQDADAVKSPEDFVRTALVPAGLSKSDGDDLLNSWDSIAQHFAAHQVRLVPWSAPWSFGTLIARNVKAVERALLTQLGRDCLENVWLVRELRSRAYAAMADAEADAMFDDQRADIATIRTWYNLAYKRSMTLQHACNNVEVSIPHNCHQYADEIDLQTKVAELAVADRIAWPEDFLRRLGSMSVEDFQQMLDADDVVATTARLWREQLARGDHDAARDALKRTIDQIVETVFHSVNDMPGRVLLGAGVAALAGSIVDAGGVVAEGLLVEQLAMHALSRRKLLIGMARGAASGGFVGVMAVEGASLWADQDKRGVVSEALVEHIGSRVPWIP